MKKIKMETIIRQMGFVFAIACLTVLCGCNNYLDQEPLSSISPEKYLLEENQLAAYANAFYDILPSGIRAAADYNSDNHAAFNFSAAFVPGEYKVSQTGGMWNFSNIYNLNYFLAKVLPRYEAGTLTGNADNIRHYIGEIYFLRAYDYFVRLQSLGDFPIVTEPLPDDLEILTEASKRAPRNEVARFILSDLDRAIELLATNLGGRKTRINKASALLLKSRVGLFEGTFLKYFKGTAFVPNGSNWPGTSKDYHSGYQFPSGNIDNEINFFLEQAIEAAQQLAPTVSLTENTGLVRQDISEPGNPYMDMYASANPSGYSEVLMWREYNYSLGIAHEQGSWANGGNRLNGLTKGLVESYLMANGLPIYAAGSGYHGDDYIADVRKDRDNRLFLFLKEPGQRNILTGTPNAFAMRYDEPVPDITSADTHQGYNTGYATRKGNVIDGDQWVCNGCVTGVDGIIIFRGVEAYLNYIEAWYERYGSLNATAVDYWKAIRTRAKVDTDIDKTIAATEMAKETGDWGAYSAGQLIDATLYNIRRERRCELMAEGLRNMDLRRWRAYDQMIAAPYHVEGFKLWGPMQEWYEDADGSSILSYGLDVTGATVSPPDRSLYLRPYEKARGSLALDGYRWSMAHYLEPMVLQNMLITSKDNDVSTSPIYQNPGWPNVVGEPAEY